MGLFGKRSLLNAKNSAQTTVTVRTLDSEELRRELAAGAMVGSISVNDQSAMTIPAVYRAIILLSNIVAGLPFRVVENGEGNVAGPVPNHSISNALGRRPNRYQSGYEFRRMMQTHLCFRGNAYARVIRPLRSSGVWEFLPLNPDRVKPELDKNTREVKYKLDNSERFIPASQMFHLRGISFDGVEGLSPIRLAAQTFGLTLQGQRASQRLMDKGVFSPFGLKHPKSLKPGAIKNIRDSLAEMFGGADNAGTPPVFEEGMEPVPLGLSSAEAQFLESRQFSVVEIARWFGIPPHMMGDVSGSTSWGTGIEQQTIGFITYTLSEWINIWESAVEAQLLTDVADANRQAKLLTSGLLRGDNKTRWDIYVKAVLAGLLSPDEARALEDMPPRADGLGGEYLTPSGAMLAEQMKEQGSQGNEGNTPPANNQE